MTKNPILFAQVREDPKIELNIVRLLPNAKCLMIGSGGCTLFSIINKNVDHIDVVDINPRQIYLIELKLIILRMFDKELILKIFNGDLIAEEQIKIFRSIEHQLSLSAREFWNQNLYLLEKGLTQCGAYEDLFLELVNSKFDYENVFSEKHLIELFGENAVKNSTKIPFSTHFQFSIATMNDNYFLNQILYNKYFSNLLPSYFDNLDNIKQFSNRIMLHSASLIDLLKNKYDYYDLIQTSNITDWMEITEIDNLLKKLYQSVKLYGYVIMRRLNGDYVLKKLVAKYFNITSSHYEDQSNLYQEIIIAQKL